MSLENLAAAIRAEANPDGDGLTEWAANELGVSTEELLITSGKIAWGMAIPLPVASALIGLGALMGVKAERARQLEQQVQL